MTTAMRYPLTVAFQGGRVRHAARSRSDKFQSVDTMFDKRDVPWTDGTGLRWCRRCLNLMDREDPRGRDAN